MSSFSFIALGDMPYRRKDMAAFDRLMTAINARNPRFVVHLGDMKSGRGSYKKGFYQARHSLFSDIQAPFIYTPGDNDWVDGKAGHKDLATPNKRLKKLRQVFFDDPGGQLDQKLWMIRQETFVENTWWTMNDVLFVTLHTIGNNNNRTANRREFDKRNEANLAWLQKSVGEAPHRAIVVFTHANLWHPTKKGLIQSGFRETVDAIGGIAQDLKVPILIMHGDKHALVVDHPVARPSAGVHLSNLTRVQVMGDRTIGAVEVAVDGNKAVHFNVQPLFP